MTFSIAAYDQATESWGVAVASKCLAVGAAVPWGRAGVGAVATQALANLSYGARGLDALAGGAGPEQVIESLTSDDELASQRQVGMVDAGGLAAAHTGSDCMDWAGHHVGDGFAVQGNLLAGPEVVDAMVAAYDVTNPHLGTRLLACLVAGRDAGGDRRGLESAALNVWQESSSYGGTIDAGTDLRVDDHERPIEELQRLQRLHHLYFERPDPDTLLALQGALRDEVGDALRSLGYDPGDHADLDAAFAEWSGVNNFEERTVAGAVDPIILEHLRSQAAGVGTS